MLSNPRLRSVLIALVLLGWLAIGAFGGMAQGGLSKVQKNDQSQFLPVSAESTRAAELVKEFVPTSTLPAFVVLEAEGGAALTPEQATAAQAFAERIGTLDLPDGRAVADVLTDPAVAVPAQDGKAVLIPVAVDAAVANDLIGPDEERVVAAVVAAIRDAAPEALDGSGLTSWVTGPAGFVADLVGAFAGIDGILLGVALLVVMVILVIVYRSPVLPLLVIGTAVFALCAAALVVKPLAGAGALLLNGQSQGILSILVIGAATDYALLLVARYREELTRNERPVDAMKVAWRASLEPILASAGTVAVGLLCLLFSDLGSNSSLGPVAAIGIGSAVLAALTLLPALLLVWGRFGRGVFWPRRPAYDPNPHDAADEHRLWARVSAFVTGHARPVWIGTAVVLLALAAFLPTLKADGTGEADVFRSPTEAVEGADALARHFDAGAGEPIQVVVAADAAPAALEALAPLEGVASAAGYTGAPAGRPGAADAPVLERDGRVLIQVTTTAAAESQAALGVVGEVREAVRAVDPDAVVGGAAAERLDTQETAARDLRTIVPVVLAAILVMLCLLLRSILAPVLLLAANVLSFAAAMGLSALVFNHVLGLPGADATVPLYGFVFLVALGIDYTIFLMTRVREEALTLGTRAAVGRALTVTGPVITSAGVVLAATFSALAVIPLLFMLQLAFIVAAGVLIDTLIVRSLLVPGLVYDAGRVVWWPWQRRIPTDVSEPTRA